MGVWLNRANFDILYFLEGVVDEFDAFHFHRKIIFMLLRSENSLMEIPLVEHVQFERILNLSSVTIDLVMLSVS